MQKGERLPQGNRAGGTDDFGRQARGPASRQPAGAPSIAGAG
ncbi:hypothetical protein ACP26L_27050 [Paenibacillus sp. S-38]